MGIETIAKNKSVKPIPVIGIEPKHLENEEAKLTHIAVAAYDKTEARSYEPGYEMQDWLEAEAEILRSY